MLRAEFRVKTVEPSTTPTIPQHANLLLAAMQLFANLFQLFILPLYILPRDSRWGVAVIFLAMLNNPFWALLHEAIHGVFHHSARLNLAAGRALSILFGAPFHILRLTHLSHHKFNRTPLERGTEIYDPDRTSKFRASVLYYLYILCGLYLLEVASSWLFFLPRSQFERLGRTLALRGNAQERWLANKFMDPQTRCETRLDGGVIIGLFVLSAYCYRDHWMIFTAMIGLRTFLISFMDNVYHYDTPINVTVSGQNLWLPSTFSRLLLHFNLHRIHHTHPNVPWSRLPELFTRDRETYDRSLWAAAVNQFAGPISQEESVRRNWSRPRGATSCSGSRGGMNAAFGYHKPMSG